MSIEASTDAESAGPRSLRAHVEDPKFVASAGRGWWTLLGVAWPTVDVTVRGDRFEVSLRFDLTGYPGVAPTARPWDSTVGQPLPPAQWPRGPRADAVFHQQWSVNMNGALYLPYDRAARPGHDGWDTQYPGHVWHAGRTIRDYLLLVRQILCHDERATR